MFLKLEWIGGWIRFDHDYVVGLDLIFDTTMNQLNNWIRSYEFNKNY